jgi:hypothetical protein
MNWQIYFYGSLTGAAVAFSTFFIIKHLTKNKNGKENRNHSQGEQTTKG